MEPVRFEGNAAQALPRAGETVRCTGLTLAATAWLLAEIQHRAPAAILALVPTPLEAEDLVRDLEFFWPTGAAQGQILPLPGYEARPFGGQSPSNDLVFARLWALWALLSRAKPLVVVASAPSALQLCLPAKALSDAAELIEAGQETDRDALVARLTGTGYYSTSIVQSQGDISVRGSILDLYPPGGRRPIRAEFFGDYLESLRAFRTLDQRSVEDLSERIILPASEIIYSAGRAGKAADALKGLAREKGWLDLLWAPQVEKMAAGQYFPGLESFLPLFHDHLATIHDYAGPEVVRVIFEPDRFSAAGAEHLERLHRHMDKIMAEERPHLPLDRLFLDPRSAGRAGPRAGRPDLAVIEVQELAFSDGPDQERVYHFPVETNQDLRLHTGGSKTGAGLLAPLAARVRSWLGRGLGPTLACHTREQARRLAELLGDYHLDVRLEAQLESRSGSDPAAGGFSMVVGFLSAGFVLPPAGVAFVTEDELFGPKRRMVRRAVEEIKGLHLSSFQDLNVGDFVVHNDHGIGQYLGLVKLSAGGRNNDYLHLTYKGGDKLYVPVERFGAVTKYVGADDRPPNLDRLGGTSWERVKERIKASIREMAEELLRLYATRQVKSGYAFTHRDSYFREFEAGFAFEETPDQMSAIDEVLKDMASPKPMDRLVCGDVGYGKTEVALRAAFKAVTDGKQVGLLVPTTILAEQHYQTFSQRLAAYPLTVEVMSRFKKQSEQKDILRRLAAGQVDVLVGTHRLLQKDVLFKDLGLLVIDEEHRFGVAAKEKLKKLRAEVDVLAMSATPIPRTLQMSLAGIRDFSVIETAPQDRLAIKTWLLKYDETSICEAISRELDRGGQVFFVHNRVKDIEMLTARLRQLMPLVRFGVGHGQLKEQELEDVMLHFVKREIDVLVTTTIIESGLDFPRANTIIINNADRFGLAQIYQLRGRVGRSTSQAYAYLFVANPEELTRDARKRLRALLDFSDLGAGYKIALHDLRIRGAGNLLGAAQSGQIAAVGHEMYVQLMERAVREIKGEESVEEVEPELILGLPAYIPETYVPDTEARLIHYRGLASAASPGEIDDTAGELLDRYGPIPVEVENLLGVMGIKYWLKKVRAARLEMGAGGLTLTFVPPGPPRPDKLMDLVRRQPSQARLSPEGRLFLPMTGLEGPAGLTRVKNILQGLL